jgi:hypothetical protein
MKKDEILELTENGYRTDPLLMGDKLKLSEDSTIDNKLELFQNG